MRAVNRNILILRPQKHDGKRARQGAEYTELMMSYFILFIFRCLIKKPFAMCVKMLAVECKMHIWLVMVGIFASRKEESISQEHQRETMFSYRLSFRYLKMVTPS